MDDREPTWLPAGSREDLAASGTLLVSGPHGAIAVFDTPDGPLALSDTCTHGQASLCEGWVEDGTVECPAHLAVFSLRTGRALSGPAIEPATTYRVEVRGDTVGVLLGAAVPDSGSAGRPDTPSRSE